MARRNELGHIRRSQVITTFGPGAIVDFRSRSGAPVSVVVAGLDQWDERTTTPGLTHPQVIYEARLQQQLRVAGFRLPPVVPQVAPGVYAENGEALLGVRFPRWLICPICNELRPAKQWSLEEGDTAPYCSKCTKNARDPAYVVPVRFIVAYESGELADFPWHWWVRHKDSCSQKKFLTLESSGSAGLSGVILRCPECGQQRSMEGCFDRNALIGAPLRPERPWLAQSGSGKATGAARATLRGASNLYFSVVSSAIDIPPWSDPLQKQLDPYWDDLKETPVNELPMAIKYLRLADKTGISPEQLLTEIKNRLELLKLHSTEQLRWQEYQRFIAGRPTPLDSKAEFEIEEESVPPEIAPWISQIVRVSRLREVRALCGFTRIRPPSVESEDPTQLAAMSVKPKNWLPAVEVRGEGVFLALNQERVQAWEASDELRVRAGRITDAYREQLEERTGRKADPSWKINPRFLLIHSLAHVLIRQLSLECGYSSASLRERLYVGTAPQEMAGLLIYTATSDSDGTLGGLARQAEPKRILELIISSLASSEWCSSDPLCINGINTQAEPLNLAACHNCLLLPETSCEEFNVLLDRGVLVGTPESPHQGYFRTFIDSI
mgnify:CR=1 FL=1